jgi:hypothetical protein
MHFKLFDSRDLRAMDALLDSYEGSETIREQIETCRGYARRKKMAAERGFGPMLEAAESHAKSFAKVADFVKANDVRVTKRGVATTQVSGFQGSYVTANCIERVAKHKDLLFPREMISVVPMTEAYVYSGDLLATLAMAENILGAKFCNTNLIGTPLPEDRFARLEKVTGERFDRRSLGDGLSQIILKNMGTPYGNLGGVEVADSNHLVYLDGITRAALATGANFFLNPSWSTIAAACYYARKIPNLVFKISMLLSTQNLMQLRMILNIAKEYARDDGTTPIYEINIGNGASPDTFIRCRDEVDASGLDISLAAHLRINPDLGMEGFDWTKNAHTVLEAGRDITIKYESDGTSRPYDTMEAYFLSDEERKEKAEIIGDVIYHKCERCDKDAKDILAMGHDALFAKIAS